MPSKNEMARAQEAGAFSIPPPKAVPRRSNEPPTTIYSDQEKVYEVHRSRAHSTAEETRQLEEQLGMTAIDTTTPPPAAEQPKSKSLWDAVTTGLGQIYEHPLDTAADSAKQVAAGSLNAFNELGNGLLDLGRWVERNVGSTSFVPEERAHGFGNMVFGEPETYAGRLANGVGQFMTGFLPTNRAMAGVKVLQGAKGAVQLVRAAASGAITDFTFFDPHQDRLSNLIQEFPSLANPVSAFLAADPNDSEALGRTKNALEGLGLGVVADGFIHSLKAMRGWRGVKAAGEGGVRPQARAAGGAAEGAAPAAKAEAKAGQEAGQAADRSQKVETPVAQEATDAEVKKAAADAEFEGINAMTPEQQEQYFSQFKDPADARRAFEVEKRVRAESPEPRPQENAAPAAGAEAEPKIDATQPDAEQGRVPRGTERRAEPSLVDRFQGTNDLISFSPKKVAKAGEEITASLLDSSGIDTAGKAININLNKIDASTDIKSVIAQVAKSFGKEIDQARRGVLRDSDVAELARDLGMTRMDLMKRAEGAAFNAEEITAARALLNASADDLIRKARAASDVGASDIEKAAFLNAIQAHTAIQMHVSGAVAEAGRALRALRQVVGLPGEKERAEAIRIMVSSFETGLDGAKVSDLAKNVAALDNIVDISKFTRKSLMGRLFDAAMEVRVNNLLSGAKTFVTNVASNMYSMFGKVGERYMAEGLGKLKPGAALNSDRVTNGEAHAMLSVMIDGIKDGYALVADSIRTRTPIDGLTQVPISRIPAISAQNFPEVPVLGQALDFLGTMVRLPGNGLNLTDAFFKAVNYRMELQALAHREAIYRGLEGQDYDNFLETFLKNPPEDIRFKAAEEARINTFTNLRPETGLLSESTIRGVQSNPLGRIALPFLRTNFNLIDYTMQRIPGLHLLSPKMMEDIAAGGARKDLAMAKLAFGSSIMLTTAALAARGLITGGGPEDPDAKKALMSTGWRPYSVKAGDTYYAYNRVEPMGTIMGMAADWSEIAGHVKSDSQSAADMALLAAATAANIGPAENLVESAIDLGELLTDPKKNAKKYISTNMASSIVPGWLRQFTREGDDPKVDIDSSTWELGRGRARYVRDDSIWRETLNRIKASIPGYGKEMPPQRNLFGEIVTYDPGWGPDIASPIATSKVVDSPVRREMARLSLQGYKFDMPPEFITTNMGAVPLTPRQYEKFVELSAGVGLKHPGLKRNLEDELNYQLKNGFPAVQVDKKYKELDANKYSMIQATIERYRKAAQNQLAYREDVGRGLDQKYNDLARVKYKNVTGKEVSVPIKPPGGGVVR